MDLLVVRHAIAEDRETFAESCQDDALRPTTAEGRRKFERGARGLRRLVPTVDVLATSPLVRAIQTGDILQRVYRLEDAARLRELAPDADPGALLSWLRRHPRQATIAVVGHEPHLSRLIEHLLTGRSSGFVDLKKGGACLLGFEGEPGPPRGALRWLLTASQLRQLRR
jgi:phosphohistidine phosphatase